VQGSGVRPDGFSPGGGSLAPQIMNKLNNQAQAVSIRSTMSTKLCIRNVISPRRVRAYGQPVCASAIFHNALYGILVWLACCGVRDVNCRAADLSPASLRFTHPLEITNSFLPLANLRQDILEGKEGAKTVRIERTAKPGVQKSFKIGSETVPALAVEDREFENGELAEVALDFFAQADDGTVCYLGEEVDEYKKGKVVGHSGSWMFGKDTKKAGIILPGHPRIGDKFKSEDVSREIREEDEVVSVSETVSAPGATYQDCVKVREHLADGTTEFKYYARGVGVVREEPAQGDVLLKSHDTRRAGH
jgi:hypothetical protein